MPKEEWGTKRLCPHCQTRFYDLQNDPMTCPSCGTQLTQESFSDGRGKAMVTAKTASREANIDETEELDDDSGDLDDDLLDDDDDEDTVSLDDIADVSEDED